MVETDKFPGLASFTQNLRTLISLARLDNTTVILMTQPSLYKVNMTASEFAALRMLRNGATGRRRQWSTGTAARGMSAYNDAIRQLAEAEGYGLVDLETAIPKTLEYFSDDVHYRAKTFDLIAEHVSKRIEPLLDVQ